MASNIEDKPMLTRTIQFRCPETLISAVQAAASSSLMSVSDVVRQSVIKDMRALGLIDENVTSSGVDSPIDGRSKRVESGPNNP